MSEITEGTIIKKKKMSKFKVGDKVRVIDKDDDDDDRHPFKIGDIVIVTDIDYDYDDDDDDDGTIMNCITEDGKSSWWVRECDIELCKIAHKYQLRVDKAKSNFKEYIKYISDELDNWEINKEKEEFLNSLRGVSDYVICNYRDDIKARYQKNLEEWKDKDWMHFEKFTSYTEIPYRTPSDECYSVLKSLEDKEGLYYVDKVKAIVRLREGFYEFVTFFD